ncbi:MAG TPA: hypothetical protein VII00_05510 [bacterium]
MNGSNGSEEKKLVDIYKRDTFWIYAFLIILLVLTVAAFYRNSTPEWKRYQADYKNLLEQNIGKDAAAEFTPEIKQVWLKDININKIDRCVSCHLGIDVRQLTGDDIPKVFRMHPNNELIKKHPIKTFGCTPCHGGKGYALTKEEAHFTDSKGWIDVFLSKELAKKYGFEDYEKMPLVEINCNSCHVHEKEVAGFAHINKAKKNFDEKLCTCCHNFYGKGGLVGPDLTYEGDKPADLYDFAGIKTWEGLAPSVFSWHFLHFKHPYFVTLNTLMPNLNLKDEEIRALAMLVLSYKRVPEQFKVKPPAANVKAAGE